MTTYDNIKRRRNELNLSQQDLANKLGYSDRSTIARIELGLVDLSISKIEAFAKALDIPVTELVHWDDPNKIKTNNENSVQSHTYIFNPVLASAGSSGFENGYTDGETIEVPDELLGKYAGRKDLQFVKVNGESMNNIIKSDSVVAYITEPGLVNLNTGDIVLYRYQSDYGIKHYYDLGNEVIFKPNSNMQEFKEQRFPKDENLEIVGKVVIYSVFM